MAEIIREYEVKVLIQTGIFEDTDTSSRLIAPLYQGESAWMASTVQTRGWYYVTRPKQGYVKAIFVSEPTPSTIEIVPDPCLPPESVTADSRTQTVTIKGGSGGKDLNAFIGWGVSWKESPEGDEYVFGDWSEDTLVTESTFAAETTPGHVRVYRARTMGTAGAEYYSDYVEASNVLFGVSAVSAPSLVFINPSQPAYNMTYQYTISWRNAENGISNPITGYEIYRLDPETDEWVLDGTVQTSQTSYEYQTWADMRPLALGETLSYKVKTLGTVSGYDSGLSEATATATGSYATTGASTMVYTSSKSTYPKGFVALVWSGATDGGELNPIVGYEIYRSTALNGTFSLIKSIKATEKNASVLVEAPFSPGAKYYFKVKTIGKEGGFSSEQSIASEQASVKAVAYTPSTALKGQTNAAP